MLDKYSDKFVIIVETITRHSIDKDNIKMNKTSSLTKRSNKMLHKIFSAKLIISAILFLFAFTSFAIADGHKKKGSRKGHSYYRC